MIQTKPVYPCVSRRPYTRVGPSGVRAPRSANRRSHHESHGSDDERLELCQHRVVLGRLSTRRHALDERELHRHEYKGHECAERLGVAAQTVR